MTRFQHCLKTILRNEGGYSDHKSDRGGKTNYGVTQARYDEFRAEVGMPTQPVKLINQAEVEGIYWQYWLACHAGKLYEPLDLLVFDFAVNSGAKRAIKYLQMTLGVDADGIWGPRTAYAIQEEIAAGRERELCREYLDAREDFYNRIVENDPEQGVFLKGWMARIDHLAEVVHG